VATVDFTERTIELNVAYFGPSQAGSGTNVRHLHRIQPGREKAELRSSGGKDGKERVWWFAYTLPDAPRVPGFEIKVRVCSVPGGPDVAAGREDMFTGMDGVVFVADARASRTEDNLAALLDLEQSLVRHGIDLAALPVVFQVNQTDAQNARTPERVVEDLNPWGFPVFEAMARQGKGVVDTHEAILAAVVTRVRDNLSTHHMVMPIAELSRANREDAESVVMRHTAQLPPSSRSSSTGMALPASVEILMRPPELRGAVPVQHVRTEVRGERLRVDTVFRRNDGTYRKLALLIEPGGEEAPTARVVPVEAPAPPPPQRRVFAPDSPGEMPRLAYGISGLVAGVLTGIMVGYILYG
jgi:signal recognition particle receptor subunit beta